MEELPSIFKRNEFIVRWMAFNYEQHIQIPQAIMSKSFLLQMIKSHRKRWKITNSFALGNIKQNMKRNGEFPIIKKKFTKDFVFQILNRDII
jgi:hypothetical protein